jgi:hypothetical protein
MRHMLAVAVVVVLCRTSGACPVLTPPTLLPTHGACLPPRPSLYVLGDRGAISMTSGGDAVAHSEKALLMTGGALALGAQIENGPLEVVVDWNPPMTKRYTVSASCRPAHAARSITARRDDGTLHVTIDSDAVLYRFEWPTGRQMIRPAREPSYTWRIEPAAEVRIVGLFSDGSAILLYQSEPDGWPWRQVLAVVGLVALALISRRLTRVR